MRVKTAGIANVAPGGKIKAIQEDSAEFTLQFEDVRRSTSGWPTLAHPWRFVTRIIGWNTWADQFRQLAYVAVTKTRSRECPEKCLDFGERTA
jgi:hypothetical protein